MAFAPHTLTRTTRNGLVPLVSSQLAIWILFALCFGVLATEVAWREYRLHKLRALFENERVMKRTDDVAKQTQAVLAEVERERNEQRAFLTNAEFLSGSLARKRHKEEWALRLAHDPGFAQTSLETNLVNMEALGRDPALTAQAALEKVATLAAPSGARVEVVPMGNSFRVRDAIMMSSLSSHEAGAVTKHTTIDSLRAEIQDLSTQVLCDLYDYCGSRGIESVSVSCDHTVRQAMIPRDATPRGTGGPPAKRQTGALAIVPDQFDSLAGRADFRLAPSCTFPGGRSFHH